ncbi:MAG: cyclic nucleotide-binding protein [Leeuwenhoekiella sp.]|nr:MAG: cyclic nucleotide-binding protein [Leeuwenhoekiella sp.]
MDTEIEELLNTENEHIRKLQEIVKKTVEDENLILQNLLNPPKEILTKGQKISDKVARFGGSWAFIISFFIILVIWIGFNATAPSKDAFDPYPFILMNLVLSCIAALQAPIIMMSQNRQEEKDRKRGENDYLINLKAELEIRSLNEKLDALIEDQFKILFNSQARQLEMLKAIQKKIEAKDPL